MLKFLVSAQNKIAELRNNESGNAAEYGLIIGLVAVVIIAGLVALAAGLTHVFTTAGTTLTNVK